MRIVNVSKVTILKWIQSGKLDPPPKQDLQNGYYLWTAEDVRRLQEVAFHSRASFWARRKGAH